MVRVWCRDCRLELDGGRFGRGGLRGYSRCRRLPSGRSRWGLMVGDLDRGPLRACLNPVGRLTRFLKRTLLAMMLFLVTVMISRRPSPAQHASLPTRPL